MRKRVLVIDDEALIRRTLSDYLDQSGYQAVVAKDGAEGLERARENQYDVVLVDLRMPRVDGLEVIDTLRVEQPDLPVVVVSGTGVLHDAVEAIRRGAEDYITKPIRDMEEVELVIERVMDKRRLRLERDRYQRELEDLNRSLEVEIAGQTESLLRQNLRLEALNRVSRAISAELELDTMLERAIEAAVEATRADGGVVRLLNPATNKLVVAASRGLSKDYLDLAEAIPLGEGVIGLVAQDGCPRAGTDMNVDRWVKALSSQFHSYICVPLRAGEKSGTRHPIVGTLGIVAGGDRRFDHDEMELLTVIGSQIGVAVARAVYASDLQAAVVQLERANADLRQLDALREQFIQNVSHELRTPLALVRGYIEMLAQEDLEAEERERALDVANRRVEVLVNLVEAISTLQDLSTKPLDLEDISVAELLQAVGKMVAPRVQLTGVELRVSSGDNLPDFPGDFTRLVQALHHLIDNACKFSPPGGQVDVSVWVMDDAMCFSVSDQGVGIPREEHARIFDRFYQVDGTMTRRYSGTGLGLALVKEVVEAHGGRVEVESKLGEGSTFTVCFPQSRGQAD